MEGDDERKGLGSGGSFLKVIEGDFDFFRVNGPDDQAENTNTNNDR